MAVTVKKVTLWRAEVLNQPGVLSGVLGPLAAAGADLQVVLGYRYRGNERKAAIEVCPIAGRKAAAAARQAGLSPMDCPTLLVQGDDRPGLGQVVSQALAAAGINVAYLMAQVVEDRFSAVMGFENEADSRKAAALLKKALR